MRQNAPRQPDLSTTALVMTVTVGRPRAPERLDAPPSHATLYVMLLRSLHPLVLALARASALVALLALAGCDAEPEWSPLDGPWDPNHPQASAILEPPAPCAPVDREMAEAGERWYRVRGCLACHRLDGVDVAGPHLNSITRRREYDWFRAMVMRPDSMLRVDPIARELLEVYRVPMPNQGVNDLHVRAIWEYLRSLEDPPA
jgi:hypothetical protein